MQPYFFPYLGYFNLISACDAFISLDNVQYIYKGYVNRNRILQANGIYTFTVPLTATSRELWINQRTVAQEFECFKYKFLKQLTAGYSRAPFFEEILELIEEILNSGEKNLARLCEATLIKVLDHLGLSRKFYIASQLLGHETSQQLSGKDKIIRLVQSIRGTHYLNPLGGIGLYQEKDFKKKGLKISFVKPILPPYQQGNKKFNNRLSIIDVLMFNSRQEALALLEKYEIIN